MAALLNSAASAASRTSVRQKDRFSVVQQNEHRKALKCPFALGRRLEVTITAAAPGVNHEARVDCALRLPKGSALLAFGTAPASECRFEHLEYCEPLQWIGNAAFEMTAEEFERIAQFIGPRPARQAVQS